MPIKVLLVPLTISGGRGKPPLIEVSLYEGDLECFSILKADKVKKIEILRKYHSGMTKINIPTYTEF
ncbi:hypothetical protein [Niallia sp. NCCP-28]|uniref:hypothetical protein n=1 Tax=Niallia sp. NCCP-28 TaxID=2934712 RepID=UPI0020890613|nr:hypothetical protein [Niallia sp. NCCP-28]GKU82735.1 hypothetical protein NCCP28_21310 [Niallia sp. NCCP-28]